jgi:hypothetical protein
LKHKAILFVLALAACDGSAAAGGTSARADASSAESAAAGAAALCVTSDEDGTTCSGGDNTPGLTGISVNNQGLIGNSIKGRGVYGSSMESEGGYFSSTDGDGLLAYSVNGYAGHFTGGQGVTIDPPGVTGAVALTANGPARIALPAASGGVIPVCGTLDAATGLFTLTKCDDRLDKLETEVAQLMARLGSADAGTSSATP